MRKISNSLTSSFKHLGLSIHICHVQEKNKKYPTGGFFQTDSNISRQMQIISLWADIYCHFKVIGNVCVK